MTVRNYVWKKISGIKKPPSHTLNPERIPEDVPFTHKWQDFNQVKCPKCGTVYTVPAYEDYAVCRSKGDGGTDGTQNGCRNNRVKYYEPSLGRYVEKYLPFTFTFEPAIGGS